MSDDGYMSSSCGPKEEELLGCEEEPLLKEPDDWEPCRGCERLRRVELEPVPPLIRLPLPIPLAGGGGAEPLLLDFLRLVSSLSTFLSCTYRSRFLCNHR